MYLSYNNFTSVLRRCWLDDRKGIRPVNKLDVGLLKKKKISHRH